MIFITDLKSERSCARPTKTSGMARGYPEPKEADAAPVPEVVTAGLCPICKRRPVSDRYCEACAAKLAE